MFVMTDLVYGAYCDKCRDDGVTVCNFVYSDISVGNLTDILQAKLCTVCSQVCKCCTNYLLSPISISNKVV